MTDDKESRHLAVVPDPPESPNCRWTDGDHGACGGPVTNVGDGRDYCWLHKDVGRQQ